MARKSKIVIRILERIKEKQIELAELLKLIKTSQHDVAVMLVKGEALKLGIDEDMELLEAAKPEPRTMKKDKDAT